MKQCEIMEKLQFNTIKSKTMYNYITCHTQ